MYKMIVIRLIVFCVVLVSFSMSVFASTQDEIEHLLAYVEKTDCQYERNGTLHTGVEAVEHINKKYDYFNDDINTTEDFIAYSATKSKMSGKYYTIHCGDKAPVKSQDWLLKELARYRSLAK